MARPEVVLTGAKFKAFFDDIMANGSAVDGHTPLVAGVLDVINDEKGGIRMVDIREAISRSPLAQSAENAALIEYLEHTFAKHAQSTIVAVQPRDGSSRSH